MMAPSGYVQLRRGLLEHFIDGRLSSQEGLVLITLIGLADSSTGRGTINAPALRYWLPDLSKDASKRTLTSLEDKRYIYRHIKPFSKRVYEFWVARYICTTGKHKSLQIDLSEVFKTKRVEDIKYVNHAPETAPQGAPETAPQGAPETAHNYKTREEELTKEKETTTTPMVKKSCVTDDVHVSTEKRTTCSTSVAARDAHVIQNVSQRDAHVFPINPLSVPGIRWSAYGGVWLDLSSGRELSCDQAVDRLRRFGLEQTGDGFRKEDGAFLTWEQGNAVIAESGRVNEFA